MKKTKKAIASLAIAGMVLSMSPMGVFAATGDTRLAGNDRFETAVKVSNAGWTSAGTAIIASGEEANLVDALAAAPLAGQEDAPILLTENTALNAVTKAELNRLGVTKVYVVGAVEDSVVNELKVLGLQAVVLRGYDRLDTATQVNKQLSSPAGTFVVGYAAIPDAMSVASYAAANHYAIELTAPDGTVDTSKLVGANKYLIGGAGVVKDSVGIERIGGLDRYDTNKAVLDKFDYQYDKVYVANGETLVDALTGAPLAAKDNASILLSDATNVKAATSVNAKMDKDSVVVALGGTAVVSDSVLGQVEYQAPAIPVTLEVESVTAVNANELQVVFNQEVTAATAQNLANYTIDLNQDGVYAALDGERLDTIQGAEGTKVTKATLESDLKTVNLYVGTAFTANDKMAKVKISGVKTADNKTVTTYDEYVLVDDNTAPTIKSVAMTATNELTIEFSENISSTTPGALSIDGTSVPYTPGVEKAVIDVTSLALADGSHTLSLVGAKDVNAENFISPNPTIKTFEVGADKTAPTIAAITVSKEGQVKLVFSEKLAAAPAVTVVDGKAAETNSTAVVSADADDSTGKTYLADLTVVTTAGAGADELVYGASTFLNKIVKVETFADTFGNAGTTVSKAVTFQLDKTKPVAQSVDSANGKLVLKFSEDVAVGTGNATVKFTNDTGIVYSENTIAPAFGAYDVDGDGVIDAEYATIDLVTNTDMTDGTNLKKGKFSIELPAGFAVDTASTPNATALTILNYDLTTSNDAAAPTASVTTIDKNGLEITFSEEMGASATTEANYTIGGTSLPYGANAYFNNDRKHVRVDLPEGSIDISGDREVAISANVTDLAGNAVASAARSITASLVDNTKAKLTKVEAIDSQTLKLTFDELVYDGNDAGTTDVKADFEVYVNGVKVAVSTIAAAETNAGKTTMIVNLTNAYTLTDTIQVKVLSTASVAKDIAGNALAGLSVNK